MQSVRFAMSHTELLWRADLGENSLSLGLRVPVPEETMWFILGVQSTDEDPQCGQAMDQWKQSWLWPTQTNLSPHFAPLGTANPAETEGEQARARANVILRVEQQEGENSILSAGPSPKATEDGRKSALNIRKLEGEKGKGAEGSQGWHM